MHMVRTRFAPSPTGKMHVGNLRTALFEYLTARHSGGTFILRIEDTDRKRHVEGAVDIIYDTLKSVGIIHDEGPDIGGPYAPYIQSERLGIYMEAAKNLVEAGHAYYCFCGKERLDELEKYDRTCLYLPVEQIEENLRAKPFVVRQMIPDGTVEFDDLVYGHITVSNSELDDQILIKSDGFPTYNFAHVVDDHLMEITHVVRGSEFLPSTPKFVLLYKAFGWDMPAFVHLPLILSEDGGKMGKRKGNMSFDALVGEGYLPEAVINFIALLGWSPADNREIYNLSELAEVFDINHISKSPSMFDFTKLAWMNGEYIKKMPFETFYSTALPYMRECVKIPGADYKKIAAMAQPRINFFKEIAGLVDFLDVLPEYDADMYTHKKMKTDGPVSLDVLQRLKVAFTAESEWSEETLYGICTELAVQTGYKNGQVFWPLRTALSGKQNTPCGATEIAALIGKNESLRRIDIGIKKLSG